MTEKLNLQSKWCLGKKMDSTSKRLNVTTTEKMFNKPKTRKPHKLKSKNSISLTKQVTIKIWFIPPKESCNMRVSLLSRYGTWLSLTLKA